MTTRNRPRAKRKLGPSKARQKKSPASRDEAWALECIESAKNLICICKEGKIKFINDAGATMFGLKSAKRMAGRTFVDFVHPDYREFVSELVDGHAREINSLPLRFVTGRGRKIDADVSITPISDELSGGLVSVHATDITHRLRSAKEVMRSENRYRDLVENSMDMICVCEKGAVTFINPAGAAMLHESEPGRLIGRKLYTLVHPDYYDIALEGLHNFVQDRSVLPLKFVCIDGEVIYVEILVLPFGRTGNDSYMLEARDVTERVRYAEKLRDREQRLRGIMDTVADGIISIDEKGVIHSFNPAAEVIFGYRSGDLIGKSLNAIIPPSDKKKHDGHIRKYIKTGKAKIIAVGGREVKGHHKDGTVFPIELSVTEMWHGKQRLFTAIVRDITERKKAEDELRKAHDELEIRIEERTRELTREIAERRSTESRLRLAGEVIDNLNNAVIILDPRFKVTAVNPAYTLITGYPAEDLIGRQPPFKRALKKHPELYENMLNGIKYPGHWEGEFWSRNKDGVKIAQRLAISAITNEEGEVQQYAAIISDISERKRAEERIFFQANYDALTGLPNRALFHDRLEIALPSHQRLGRKLGLMFIDLDGFKLVNDTLGHDIGDLLLQETARRLEKCIRDGDTAARLGGDEFTVIMPNLVDPRHTPLVAQRVLDALAKPFNLKNHETFVSASIGVTIFPDDATTPNGLLKNADAAMYRAKEQGKANYQFYTSDLNKEVKERLEFKNGLVKALGRGEFSLHYQPKLEIGSNRITGAEALMRWNSRDYGLISPVKFIPILEETGQVVEVGEWAIRTACERQIAWKKEGLPPLRVAVNISARQLREKSFISIVDQALKDTGVSPDGLEIEITESMLMSDQEKAVKSLGELHDMGIHIAMDDFGTGYSSLSYLKRFPIDTIKIDRSFVADIATDHDDAIIIKTIINMGQNLNRRIVAEGVETESQLAILNEYNCDEIQGYFFSPPLPEEKFTDFIKEKMNETTKTALAV